MLHSSRRKRQRLLGCQSRTWPEPWASRSASLSDLARGRHTGLVKSRPKLSGAPLAYSLAKVEGTAEPYQAFGKALWAKEAAIPAALKELVFLRSSIVNQCPT